MEIRASTPTLYLITPLLRRSGGPDNELGRFNRCFGGGVIVSVGSYAVNQYFFPVGCPQWLTR